MLRKSEATGPSSLAKGSFVARFVIEGVGCIYEIPHITQEEFRSGHAWIFRIHPSIEYLPGSPIDPPVQPPPPWGNDLLKFLEYSRWWG